MEILLSAIYAALFVFIIVKVRFFHISGIRRQYMAGAFLLKVLFGVALSLIYADYYTDRKTGDTYKFFDDAKAIHDSREKGSAVYIKVLTGFGLENDPVALDYYQQTMHLDRQYQVGFVNDNATVVRLNAVLMWFSFGYYQIHTIFWCFLSFIGLTGILKILVKYFPRKKTAMFFSVFLLPTVLFWGSGVLKEPIFLLGLGLFLLGLFQYIYGHWSWKDIVALIIGLLLLILAKGYVLWCILPACAGLLLAKFTGGRRFWLWFGLPHFLGLLLLFILPEIDPNLNVADYMRQKQEAFYNVGASSDAGSMLEVAPIDGPLAVVTGAPEAMMNTYLRPWPWEWSKILYIPAAIENLMLLICLLVMLWNFRRPYGLEIPIFAFCISFVLILGILAGEVVPILGALVRYKLPSLIFLFVAIFICTDHIMLQRRLPFVRRIIRKL